MFRSDWYEFDSRCNMGLMYILAATIIDKAMMLTEVGGTYGGTKKPTKFLCLVLKLLQIQPEKEIIVEFIKNEEFRLMASSHKR